LFSSWKLQKSHRRVRHISLPADLTTRLMVGDTMMTVGHSPSIEPYLSIACQNNVTASLVCWKSV
jgi:hypothetical protein